MRFGNAERMKKRDLPVLFTKMLMMKTRLICQRLVRYGTMTNFSHLISIMTITMTREILHDPPDL